LAQSKIFYLYDRSEMFRSVLPTYSENSIRESNNILHIVFSILMNNRTKLTIVAAFIVAGMIVGATIVGSIPSFYSILLLNIYTYNIVVLV
jgi:hypothetical protein